MKKGSSFQIIFNEQKPTIGGTKFGGQPDWLERPQWPIGLTSGKQMKFVCQIKLDEIALNYSNSRYAYFFIDEDDEGLSKTWLADGGDNAIILQPGTYQGKYEKHKTGPSIYKMVKKWYSKLLKEVSFESSVELIKIKETNEIITKFLGQPSFLQAEEYPDDQPETWQLLFQLDSTILPFYINFAGSGVGYGFINSKGTQAKFIWQK